MTPGEPDLAFWKAQGELETGDRRLGFHVLEQAADDLIRVDTVRFGLKVHQQPMAEDGQRDRADILDRDNVAALRALPPRSSACPALGPAPQRTHWSIHSGTPSALVRAVFAVPRESALAGRVARTRRAA